MLKNIQLTNFRNHKNFTADFGKTTIIIGRNGVGKTNILESIYYLLTTLSYKTRRNEDLIYFDKNFFKIKANFNDGSEIETTLQVNEKNNCAKTIKLNQLLQKTAQIIGRYKIVLFSPQSIDIVLGSPNDRRSFLNLILLQNDPVYLKNLIELKKILRQRNKLLFLIKNNFAEQKELFFWDEKLISINKYIVKNRLKLIEFLNSKITSYYNKISAENNLINIDYHPTLNIKTAKQILDDNRSKEISAQKTLYGPHRDDINFFLNNRSATNFSSQGEARTLVLALKLAENDFLSNNTKQPPLFLLDDVFSELDEIRIEHIINLIDKQQTIITAAQLGDVKKYLKNECRIIKL